MAAGRLLRGLTPHDRGETNEHQDRERQHASHVSTTLEGQVSGFDRTGKTKYIRRRAADRSFPLRRDDHIIQRKLRS